MEDSKPASIPLLRPTTLEPFSPDSSLLDSASTHTINQVFLAEISSSDMVSPYKTQVRQLVNFMEQCQAEALIYKTELNDVKEINSCRKEKEGGKRHVLKDTPVALTERIEQALKEREEAINRKKKGKGKCKQKRTKRQVVPSEDDTDSNIDDSSDIEEHIDLEIFDCIEVA